MRKPAGKYADVVASWSGGIDSTGVVASLLLNGYRVRLVTLNIYGGDFAKRERAARENLMPVLKDCATEGDGEIIAHDEYEASWIWAFSPDGTEIPRRNKHIIDHIITAHCMPRGIKNIGMGEYIGADSWLVRDHVGGSDADARSLAAYIVAEYGLEYRLLTLADFGESRYKVDRLGLLVEAIGPHGAGLTSNCLYDYDQHCGRCYKCIERSVSFKMLGLKDPTEYIIDPTKSETWVMYQQQMMGENIVRHFSAVDEDVRMPKGANV